jgi:hypothetical protein
MTRRPRRAEVPTPETICLVCARPLGDDMISHLDVRVTTHGDECAELVAAARWDTSRSAYGRRRTRAEVLRIVAGLGALLRALTLRGRDGCHVYPGTRVLGVTAERRSALTIVFDGECGHAWELRIQQHKGINLVTVGLIASREPEE